MGTLENELKSMLEVGKELQNIFSDDVLDKVDKLARAHPDLPALHFQALFLFTVKAFYKAVEKNSSFASVLLDGFEKKFADENGGDNAVDLYSKVLKNKKDNEFNQT